jgi:hypothetical protein
MEQAGPFFGDVAIVDLSRRMLAKKRTVSISGNKYHLHLVHTSAD